MLHVRIDLATCVAVAIVYGLPPCSKYYLSNDIVKSIMKKDSSFLGYLLARFNISIGIKLYALIKTNTHSCIFFYCLFTNTYGKTCKCTLANIELPKVFVEKIRGM